MKYLLITLAIILGFYLYPYNIRRGETGLGNLLRDSKAVGRVIVMGVRIIKEKIKSKYNR